MEEYQQNNPRPYQQQNNPQPYHQQNNSMPYQQTIVVNQPSSNGLGTAGFVFSLITLFLGWIPVLGWILWFLGAIFSLIGVFKAPRGLAIAGLIISFIGLIVLIFLIGIFAAALSLP